MEKLVKNVILTVTVNVVAKHIKKTSRLNYKN